MSSPRRQNTKADPLKNVKDSKIVAQSAIDGKKPLKK